ncbi:uncharacterized protein [Physcomitrium patens]|uniref:VQ domain-containing protein n=1 Tax=Physcomitrium patens TaxID=3218 RepID=A0A2K1J9A3_PHYPA|nr:uncharacterized protein LOC112293336 [Physcomitrium patens]PNR38099.1 hypothetical protein PHYPA_021210 [Physcomitrium patens]|eukprot:XP_024398395.1 uncharacterized protein LOC112293336 [Physcomitrella patens]
MMANRTTVDDYNCTPRQSTMGLNKNSHGIGKPAYCGGSSAPTGRHWHPAPQPPHIRVIHIFAPKVIQTDVANFKSTVQKLTGKSRKKSGRRSQSKQPNDSVVANPSTAVAGNSIHQDAGSFMDQLNAHEMRRFYGSGADPLVRSNNEDSTTYSLDSCNTFSIDSGNTVSNIDAGDFPSPTDGSVSNCTFQPRETPYALSEILAPFFGADMISHPSFNDPSPMLSHHGLDSAWVPETSTSHVPPMMDTTMSSMLGIDMDIGSDPLPEHPFASLTSSLSGGLYDMMPGQHCRLSVHRPLQGSIFESI